MSFIKPVFALLLAALVGATAVACTGGEEDTAKTTAE
jgi:hypothetical protein